MDPSDVLVRDVVWVFHPEAKAANAVIVVRDGRAVDYSGESRLAALEFVLGRKASVDEVIMWTQPLDPAVVVVG